MPKLCAVCNRYSTGFRTITPPYAQFDTEQVVRNFCSYKHMEKPVTDFTRVEEAAIQKIVEQLNNYFIELDKWNLEDWSNDDATGLVRAVLSMWIDGAVEDSLTQVPSMPA